MKLFTATAVLFGLVLGLTAIVLQPVHPTRNELVQINQQLSLQNLELQAELSTVNEECK